MRIFVALSLSPESKQRIHRLQETLKTSGVEGRMLPENSIHLTLRFLGESSESEARKVLQVVKNFSESFRPQALKVRGLESMGFKCLCLILEPSRYLQSLKDSFDKVLMQNGFKLKREGSLKPHLTLFRGFKENCPIPAIPEEFRDLKIELSELNLYMSVQDETGRSIAYRVLKEI